MAKVFIPQININFTIKCGNNEFTKTVQMEEHINNEYFVIYYGINNIIQYDYNFLNNVLLLWFNINHDLRILDNKSSDIFNPVFYTTNMHEFVKLKQIIINNDFSDCISHC